MSVSDLIGLLPIDGVLRQPRKREPHLWLKPGIFLGGLVPVTYIVLRATRAELGANPVAEIENELGLTALIFLLSALACSPARRLIGWTWPMRVRRELGLFAFFYALLHFLTYLTLDQFFDWGAIVADVIQRPFITVGFAALVLMTPLAITSTNAWVRRLGYKRWVRVHQLAYVSGALAALHFIWRVKIDISQPLTYAIVLGALFAVRVGFWLRARSAKNRGARQHAPVSAATGTAGSTSDNQAVTSDGA